MGGSVSCGCAAPDDLAPSDGPIIVGALFLCCGMGISMVGVGDSASPTCLAPGDGSLLLGALLRRSRLGLRASIADGGLAAAAAGPATPVDDPALAGGLLLAGV